MNSNPLEKYALEQLKQNKYNIDNTIKAIRNKYPFIKNADLKSIISTIILQKANNKPISGFWRKLNNQWVIAEHDYASGFSWSGDELPASADSNSLGPARNVYNTIGDRPSGSKPKTNKLDIQDIEDIDNDTHEHIEENEQIKELQEIYERIMAEYAGHVKPVAERHEMVTRELKESGYGDLVNQIKPIK